MMLNAVADIYRRSKKRNDNLWTEWVARPPAALVVWALEKSRITPNQLSFFGIAIFKLAAAVFLLCPSRAGALGGWLILQASYVIDCADGQLARLKGLSTPAGALLDFLLDEAKALLLIGAISVRLWWWGGHESCWLLWGVLGLLVASTGMTLTTFTRRKEYLDTIGAPPIAEATDRGGHAPRSLHPVVLAESLARFLFHYPSWLLVPCLLNRLDWFLWIYVAVHILYCAKISLTILLKLGSFSVYQK